MLHLSEDNSPGIQGNRVFSLSPCYAPAWFGSLGVLVALLGGPHGDGICRDAMQQGPRFAGLPCSGDRNLQPCRAARLSSPISETSCIPVALGSPGDLQGCCGVGIGICRDAVQQEWDLQECHTTGICRAAMQCGQGFVTLQGCQAFLPHHQGHLHSCGSWQPRKLLSQPGSGGRCQHRT